MKTNHIKKIMVTILLALMLLVPVSAANVVVQNGKVTAADAEIDSTTLTVDESNDRVGIGTDNPQADLQVHDASNAFSTFKLTDSATGTTNGAELGSYQATFDFNARGTDGTDGQMHFRTGSNVVTMSIDKDGEVGIGTTSQTDNLELVGEDNQEISMYSKTFGFGVQNNFLKFYGNNSGGQKTLHAQISSAPGSSDSNAGQMIFTTGDTGGSSSEKMRIDETGNVGIGESSPEGTLHLREASGNPQFFMEKGDAGADSKLWDFLVGSDTFFGRALNDANSAEAQWLQVQRSGNSITDVSFPSGNVGVATTSPAKRFVVQDGSATGAFRLGADSGATTFTNNVIKVARMTSPIYTSAGNADLLMLGATNQNGENILQIGGGTSSLNSATDIRFYTQSGATSQAGTEKMRIDSNGYVGLGTTSPVEELHIRNATGSTPVVRIEGTSAASAVLELKTASRDWFIQNDQSNDILKIRDLTSGVDRFAIDSSGNVGVQTLDSASGNDLCYQTGTISGMNTLSTCSSSIRYKDNVENLNHGLETVKQMRPVTFDWKKDGVHDLGFVAEEMEAIDPLFATYKNGTIEGVKYKQLTAVLTKAVQEQQEQIENQQDEIDQLKQIVCLDHPDAAICQ